MTAEQTPDVGAAQRQRVGLVLAAFPARNTPALKYFVLLLNRLQTTFEFEFYDPPTDDPFIRTLENSEVDADETRDGLLPFAQRLYDTCELAIKDNDLASSKPAQVVLITSATLSNLHFLIRRKHVSLLALGEWDRSMSPPSALEFLQLLVLRAAFSYRSRKVFDTIHLGTRACIFDFTINLEDTRFLALAGVGTCSECGPALIADGLTSAPSEIRYVAERSWLGLRSEPGSPAHIMASLGYDLFLTKGFTATWREQAVQLLQQDAAKEFLRVIGGLLLAGLIFWLGWKAK